MIDKDRLFRRFMELGEITEKDRPWTRRSFTPLFERGRDYLRDQMQRAGMAVRVDPAGNLIGRLEGSTPNAPAIVTGSHSDTVPEGGRFDGIAGILCGIEVAAALSESGTKLRHPFEVVDFLAEEPSEYGLSCIGSRGIVGQLSREMLQLTAPNGETLEQGLRRIGADPSDLSAAQWTDKPKAFVELHIEQGPMLERQGIEIGVVTSIVGINRLEVTAQGQPDHAGTTPMDVRRDAVAGAAKLITWINEQAAARAEGPHYLVATVGRMVVTPNAPNIVPAKVDFVVDLRSDQRGMMEDFAKDLHAALPGLLSPLRLDGKIKVLSDGLPTAMAQEIQDRIIDASEALGRSYLVMPSGAGHDAAWMARICPSGMIFVPCLDGRSHCPEEWADAEQLFAGTEVLLKTIQLIDQGEA